MGEPVNWVLVARQVKRVVWVEVQKVGIWRVDGGVLAGEVGGHGRSVGRGSRRREAGRS